MPEKTTEQKIDEIHSLLAGSLERPGLVHLVRQHDVDLNHETEGLKKKLAGIERLHVKAAAWMAGAMFVVGAILWVLERTLLK